MGKEGGSKAAQNLQGRERVTRNERANRHCGKRSFAHTVAHSSRSGPDRFETNVLVSSVSIAQRSLARKTEMRP